MCLEGIFRYCLGIVVLFFVLTGTLGCGGNTASTTSSSNQHQPSYNWNMKELNAVKNGNIPIAIQKMKADGALKDNTTAVAAAVVLKRPWEYYGKIITFSGTVGIVQDYPPGSDISKAFGGKGTAAEIVLISKDDTPVDVILNSSSGSIKVGQQITIYGYPVGQVEVQNRLGGNTTQLFVVGQLADSATPSSPTQQTTQQNTNSPSIKQNLKGIWRINYDQGAYFRIEVTQIAEGQFYANHHRVTANGGKIDSGKDSILGSTRDGKNAEVSWKSSFGGKGRATVRMINDNEVQWTIDESTASGDYWIPRKAVLTRQ